MEHFDQGSQGAQVPGYARKQYEEEVTDNLSDLFAVLPPHLVERLQQQDTRALIELVLDLGRKPEARFDWGELQLDEADVMRGDLDYVAERIENYPVRVTQLAHGLPVGGELDYLDEGTLAQAIRARRPLA